MGRRMKVHGGLAAALRVDLPYSQQLFVPR
jgi:hypothetical protein